jgi:3-hydroxymyristoyl/3-hydroxydecanoyl-(acyl carrier protein) dehydratase
MYNKALITKLLPHRSPFLMVDTVTFYHGGNNPSLNARYTITENEPSYSTPDSDGHWPSIYVIEGLGQSCNLMIIISVIEKRFLEAGILFESMDEVLMKIMNDESDEITEIVKSTLDKYLTETYSSVGFLGSADMEITGYARQGHTISYEIQQSQMFGSLYFSTVRAYSDNHLIARGTLVSATRKN